MSKIKKLYLLEWDDAKLERWANIREKGKWRYVATRFVPLWGGGMAIAMSAWTIYFSSLPLYQPRVFVINFIVWSIFGFFLGISVWHVNEKKYIEYKSKSNST